MEGPKGPDTPEGGARRGSWEVDPMDRLRQAIDHAGKDIDIEMGQKLNAGGPENSWFAGFNNRTQVILSGIGKAQRAGLISPQQAEEMEAKILAISSKCRDRAKEYRDTKEIPEEVKNELLDGLKQILDPGPGSA
jgi:hypothetical protein